jgi:hypothetical protein
MVLRMITSYGLQATQMNEKPPRNLSLNLTITQHFCDDNPEPRKVCPHFKVKPLRTWYY